MKSFSFVAFLAALNDAFTFFPRRAAALRKESEHALDAEWQDYFRQGCHNPNGEFALLIRQHNIHPLY
jgi:hypothetical protein